MNDAEKARSVDADADCPWAGQPVTVERVADANLPTEIGEFRIAGYRSLTSDEEFVALYKGDLDSETPTLVRIHSQCLTGDVFGSIKCDCGPQLHRTMEMIEAEGRGAIVYQQQEGRGIGIINKIRAYELQDQGADTVEANQKLGFAVDARNYQQCAEILFDLGLCNVRVISNNPEKLRALESAGLKIVERIPIDIEAKEPAAHYLKTKKRKDGPPHHALTLEQRPEPKSKISNIFAINRKIRSRTASGRVCCGPVKVLKLRVLAIIQAILGMWL